MGHVADLDLPCPCTLELGSAAQRALARTVLLVAERRGCGDLLLSRYPADFRQRLAALAAAESLDFAVRDPGPSEERLREAWIEALDAAEICAHRTAPEGGEG